MAWQNKNNLLMKKLMKFDKFFEVDRKLKLEVRSSFQFILTFKTEIKLTLYVKVISVSQSHLFLEIVSS